MSRPERMISISASSDFATAKPAAVLFDMDGTFMDTEPLWFRAELSYVRQFGCDWTQEQALEMVGRPLTWTGAQLVAATGSDDSPEEVVEFLSAEMVRTIGEIDQLPWRPGIEELLADLKLSGVPTALVSSSPLAMVAKVVERLPGGYLDFVLSGDEVENLKPHPEPYLKAAAALGVEPGDCVVLEDSASGVRSGLAAGTNVIGIPCMMEIPAEEGLSRVASAEELSVELLARIGGGEVVDELT